MARNAILLLLAGAAIAQGSILRSAAPKEEAPKEDGKGTPALAGKMPLKAQEQGYSGEHVKHEDQKTSTADWGTEYGHEKGGHPEPKQSAGSRSFMCVALPLLVVSAAIY